MDDLKTEKVINLKVGNDNILKQTATCGHNFVLVFVIGATMHFGPYNVAFTKRQNKL